MAALFCCARIVLVGSLIEPDRRPSQNIITLSNFCRSPFLAKKEDEAEYEDEEGEEEEEQEEQLPKEET
jgi:hypothetical protein